MKCVKSVAQGGRESFKGSRSVLPSVAVAMIITAVGALLATKTTVWTINMVRPVALGAIAAAGCAHLMSNGGSGHFKCSRWWLSQLFRQQQWRFRRPQKVSSSESNESSEGA